MWCVSPCIQPSAKGITTVLNGYIALWGGLCQGASKAGSMLDIWVPAELQHICKGSLKGNGSLLNAWAEMRRKLSSHSAQCQGASETRNMLCPSTHRAPTYLQNGHSRG